METADIVLSGHDLNKSYKNRDRVVTPLKHVDFELRRGEILGIVGESGSGKSTLLKVISGIEKPDSGKLYHEGKEYTGAGPEKAGRFLRMIFQDAYGSFDPKMDMHKSLHEGNPASHEELIRIISEVGLDEELLKRRPRNLSGGQCQRMSIARALLSHAITSALDVTTQAQVIKLLTEVRDEEGVSIMMISHDLALVSMVCDRIMVLKDGTIVEEGATSEVINSPQHAYTRELLSSVLAV